MGAYELEPDPFSRRYTGEPPRVAPQEDAAVPHRARAMLLKRLPARTRFERDDEGRTDVR